MTALIFNAGEVFEIARQIERNGIAFYRGAAKLMTDPDAVKLMNELAEMEVVHEQTFEHLKQRLSGNELADRPYDPHQDAYAFLKNMAEKYVFNPAVAPEKILESSPTPHAILDFAIQREKDSVIFYEAIRGMVPMGMGGGHIDEIVAQELGHVIILTRYQDKLNKVSS